MEDKLRVCKLLGLDPYQEFRIKGKDNRLYRADDNLVYRFNENGEREYYVNRYDKWVKRNDEYQLHEIICNPDLIEIVNNEIRLNFHDTIVLKGLTGYYGEKIARIDRVDYAVVVDVSNDPNFKNDKGEYVQVFFTDHRPNKEHYIYMNLDLDFLDDFKNDFFRVEYDENDNIRVYGN